ncbi:hypothetical protein H7X46_26950 [Pseudonocardia sp. C8]|uniref:hypothetical protein n=1 Tax=Pseudonocardia sp. C8 TaxID=2762759 RepID=UPI001642DE7C|nr:hypothetical protein [Pseudonocardia sp. C8]MBC3194694.1 hypothetical protein [Pseudonocardia sp. C8]
MAVRWRTRRTALARADDGRWGVARLVAQREAARCAARSAVPGPATGEPDAADPPGQQPEDTVPDPRTPRPASPGNPVPPSPRRAPAGPAPDLPVPRRPQRPSDEGPVYRPPAVSARPPVDLEPGLLGFSRLTRSRTGARAFTLFFVAIYLVILVQTLLTIV